jgi:hypothetical protein
MDKDGNCKNCEPKCSHFLHVNDPYIIKIV